MALDIPQDVMLLHKPSAKRVIEFKVESTTSCMILRQDAHKQGILDSTQPRRHMRGVRCAFAMVRSGGVSVHPLIPVNSAPAAPTDRNYLIYERVFDWESGKNLCGTVHQPAPMNRSNLCPELMATKPDFTGSGSRRSPGGAEPENYY
jgi:hypothetical protein